MKASICSRVFARSSSTCSSKRFTSRSSAFCTSSISSFLASSTCSLICSKCRTWSSLMASSFRKRAALSDSSAWPCSCRVFSRSRSEVSWIFCSVRVSSPWSSPDQRASASSWLWRRSRKWADTTWSCLASSAFKSKAACCMRPFWMVCTSFTWRIMRPSASRSSEFWARAVFSRRSHKEPTSALEPWSFRSNSSICRCATSRPSASRRATPRVSPSISMLKSRFASWICSDNLALSLSHKACAFSSAEPRRDSTVSKRCCSSTRAFCSAPKARSASPSFACSCSCRIWNCTQNSCLSSSRCCCCRDRSCWAILSLESKIC
mmetsp:Transcript_95451/g.227364  ORF Transcript_95451/g.227364 Transcript_95451/m.227364 type:complete len:321 (-) Transcript_95451:884-1846(-)